MKHLKPYDSSNGINESFWSSIFGKPTIKDASDTAFRGQGFSHTGKEEDENVVEETWFSKKIANPVWSM